MAGNSLQPYYTKLYKTNAGSAASLMLIPMTGTERHDCLRQGAGRDGLVRTVLPAVEKASAIRS